MIKPKPKLEENNQGNRFWAHPSDPTMHPRTPPPEIRVRAALGKTAGGEVVAEDGGEERDAYLVVDRTQAPWLKAQSEERLRIRKSDM